MYIYLFIYPEGKKKPPSCIIHKVEKKRGSVSGIVSKVFFFLCHMKHPKTPHLITGFLIMVVCNVLKGVSIHS